MRSELIFEAAVQVPNRFLLAKATRGLHRPGSRIHDATNGVFVRFSRSNPIADVQQRTQFRSVASRHIGSLACV